MLTQADLDIRHTYIGGSDAGTISGLNKYKTPYELWLEKTKRVVPKDISENMYVKAGNRLEMAVIQWFELETGKNVVLDAGLKRHKEHEFMAAHIDGRVYGESAILEVKTASSDKEWGETGSHTFPESYLCQLVHYCAVHDVDRAYLAVLIRGVDFRWYTYERDTHLEALIIEKQRKFWEFVTSDTPPACTTEADIITRLGEHVSDGVVVASKQAEWQVRHYLDYADNIKVLEERMKELRDKICIEMGDKQNMVDGSGKQIVSWRMTKPVKRFDSKRLKEEAPVIYNNYVTETKGSRRFTITTKKLDFMKGNYDD